MEPGPFLSAAEAADLLGVERRTLYAYVARGLLRSYPGPGRSRRYAAAEVRRLRDERDYRRTPLRAAADALRWGPPVLQSRITTVRDGQLRYRGRDASDLIGSATFEAVCALLWDVPAPLPRPAVPPEAEMGVLALTPITRFQIALATMPERAAPVASPPDVAREGVSVLEVGARVFGAAGEGRIAERLARAWAPDSSEAPVLLDDALVALADHELTAATLAARCAASTGGGIAGAVLAGLCALIGRRYAANTLWIAALFDEAETPEGLWRTLERRVRAGRATPGFGHRLYPDGDPRAHALLRVLEQTAPEAEGTAFLRAAFVAGPGVLGSLPAADLALVALCRAAGCPAEAPLWTFALARSAGFIAHAAEQIASGELIRPRAHDDPLPS